MENERTKYNGKLVAVKPIKFIKKQNPNPRPGDITRMEKTKQENLGKIFYDKSGYKMQIIEYYSKFNVTVKFIDDGTNYITSANLDNVKAGSVKNPYRTLECGGYYGLGPYICNRYMRPYKVWESMLRRTVTLKEDDPHYSTYKNTTVCEEWLCCQNFALWYIEYESLLAEGFEYNIDKDIHQWGKKNKIYSPETCCLVPKEVNDILVNIFLEKTTGLPIGVMKNGNGYSSYITSARYGDHVYLGHYQDPMEAFQKYREKKLYIIREISTEYYQKGALLEKDYNAIMKIDIYPYIENYEN